jgi:transposase
MLTVLPAFRGRRDDLGVAFNFRGEDRDQQFLMPPSVRDWLPEDHLAWFVLDVVSEFDLTEFYGRYRIDGRGGAAYEPAVMVALIVYAYCVGDRSSRRVERRLVEDVAYRVVAANATPDHATIARFRAEHESALAGLFGQVLALCAAAGLVRVGLVALDGTKIEAAAAMTANMGEDRLRRALDAEARRIIEEAKAVDAAEDELYGDARGDELPPELADRSQRLQRLRAAKARLDAAQAERDTAGGHDRSPTTGKKRTPVKDPAQKPLLVNATDPDSAFMKVRRGFCQGYNAQAIATEDQVLIAAELTRRCVDVEQLQPMLRAAVANLQAVGVDERIEVLVADAGYYSTANATADTDTELLIATRQAHKQPTVVPEPVTDPIVAFEQQEAARAASHARVFDRQAAGEITMKQAVDELGLSVAHTYTRRDRYRRFGLDGLIRKRITSGPRRPPRVPIQTVTRLEMETRLASDQGRALYKRRGQIIEPVFGQIKDPRGIRRFQRRGLTACTSEWKLIAATHNLLKLWRHHTIALTAAG